MGLFGRQEKKAARRGELEVDLERLQGLSLPELASEVARRVWGGGDKSIPPDREATDLQLVRAVAGGPPPGDLGRQVRALIAEAMNALETAGLVATHQSKGGGSDRTSFSLTRNGMAALYDASLVEAVSRARD